jgi:hypothetical protein
MFDSKLGKVGFFLLFPIVILFFLLIRWEYEIDGIVALMSLILADGSLSIINSSRHTELGSLFWLKHDYRILRFIEYNKDVYARLPVIFLLITFNFLLCIILVVLTFIFVQWNMLYIMMGMGSWSILTIIFSLIELLIYKIKYN